MSYGHEYWLEDENAPFATLLTLLSTYCDPNAMDYEALQEAARTPGLDSRMPKFKEELRQALADPTQIPGKESLYHAGHFDDGSDERYLRRLWRDLYPDEPVPGGDEEFREDLRKLIRGEVDKVPDTVDYYVDVTGTPDERIARAREVWQKFYPDEPLP